MSRRDGEAVSRIYVGNLPLQIDHREVEREFERFGKVVKCDLKKTISGAPFAFIEFEDPRDAQDAIKERDGYDFDGSRLRVEIPFNARTGVSGGNDYKSGSGSGVSGMNYYRGGSGYVGNSNSVKTRLGRRDPPRKGRYVVHISGLPLSGSWQDVKDHMREAGECGHADVFHDGTGEISFFSRRDADAAIEKFDGSIFRSHEGEKSRITVQEKDYGYGRSGDDRGYAMRYRSRSYDRRGIGNERYDGRKECCSYSRERERGGGERESDRYERRYSSSRSRTRSRSRGGGCRSRNNSDSSRSRGGGGSRSWADGSRERYTGRKRRYGRRMRSHRQTTTTLGSGGGYSGGGRSGGGGGQYYYGGHGRSGGGGGSGWGLVLHHSSSSCSVSGGSRRSSSASVRNNRSSGSYDHHRTRR